MSKRAEIHEPPVTPVPGCLPPSWTRNQTLAACVGLVILTFAVYFPVLEHDFVDYDDGEYVVGNSHVQAGLQWSGVTWAFTSGHASNWHPLTWLSHMLDISLFGQQAGYHHLTSLVLHCFNSVLVFIVLRRLTGREWPSWVVALLFALHPLHVESVAWVSERKDVLSAFFGLLSLWAYAIYAQSRRDAPPFASSLRWYLLTLVFFVLALLSKPMLVTLPFVLLLLDAWPLRRVSVTNLRTACWPLLMEKIPFFGLCLISSVITFFVQKKGGAVSAALPLGGRIANALVSYVRYLGKTIWPENLSVLYPHPGQWPTGAIAASAILLLLITAATLWVWRKFPCVTVGWLWFVGMLVPVIGLVQVGLQSMADRYTYLPHIGLFVAIVWALAALGDGRPKFGPVLKILTVAAALGCVFVTSRQVGIWRNTETLFSRAVAVTQNNYLAENNLGFYLTKQGRLDEALDHYRASLKINPNYADANNNLGHALAGQRKFTEAIGYYEIALRADPNSPEVHNNLGNALSEIGSVDEAIKHYGFVLGRNPAHVNAHNNLGIALAMKGRVPEAITHFNQALQINPNDASAYGNLGNAYATQRQFDLAATNYARALELAPRDDQTHFNLGNVLSEQNQLTAALTNYLIAAQLNSNNFGAQFRAGFLLAQLGQATPARQRFQEALRIQPNNLDVQRLLQQLQPANPP